MARAHLQPGRPLSGTLELPGDKSISHRYAILAALAEGRSEIYNFSPAADCRSTLDCLVRLGIQALTEQGRVVITGAGLHGLKGPRRALDAGNSGTTMRLLAGVLAGQPFPSKITGDGSLRRRPMRRILDPLAQMGATVSARDGNFPPLEIRGGKLRGIEYSMPVASAQVKSAVLLAGLFAEGWTTVKEPEQTRDHTEIAMRESGAEVRTGHGSISVKGGAKLRARQVHVPGDLSAAAFFLGAALIVPGSQLLLRNVGLNPTRTAVIDLLVSMGAPIRLGSLQMRDGEVLGDIAIHNGPLEGGVIRGPAIARLIDELPMLAALGPFTERGIEIRDAQELRVKESDRIAALADGLRRMGAQVEEFPDGLKVAGRAASKLRGAVIDPHGDHRIAMALAVAALGAEGETTIRSAGCVAISFPDFFATIERLCTPD